MSGERKSNQTRLLGFPYSFSPGVVNGESVVSVARLSGQFVDRSEKHVFAARVILNGGFDVLDATQNSSGPDGQFFSVIGQAQYLQRLGNTRNEVALRAVGQYTPNALLSLEELSIGGANTVRGYRENTMIRDVGVVTTLEFHLPLWQGKAERPYLQLMPFASYGAGWNHERETPSPRDIASAGIGIVLTPCKHFEASLFWGHAFRSIPYTNRDLQDDGVHFKLTVWAF